MMCSICGKKVEKKSSCAFTGNPGSGISRWNKGHLKCALDAQKRGSPIKITIHDSQRVEVEPGRFEAVNFRLDNW